MVIAHQRRRQVGRDHDGAHEVRVGPPRVERDRGVVLRDEPRIDADLVVVRRRDARRADGHLEHRVGNGHQARAVGRADVPVVDRSRVTGDPESGHRPERARAGPVVPEDVVEHQRLAERRATRQGRLEQRAVGAPPRRRPGPAPLLVTAVAVVMFFMTVLLKNRTFGASSIAMPPPSWVEMLLTIMLLVTFDREVAGHQEPDPAAVVVGEVRLDDVRVDVDGAGARRQRRRDRSAAGRRS